MANEKIEFDQKLFPTTIYGFDGQGLDAFMVIDASINDAHKASVEFTKHPIEFGANISDHGIIQPRSYTLTGRIATISTRGGDAPLDVIGNVINRPQVAWEKLQDLAFSRTIVTVESNLKVYDNIVLASLSTEQNWQTARTLDFEAVFEELFIVDAPRINIDVTSPQAEEEPPEPAPEVSVAEQAVIVENAGELSVFDQSTWATDEEFLSNMNIPDFRNVGLQ